MTEQPDDQRLWDALVAAEWEHAHRRAEFYQQARSRTDVITAALAGSSADQSTALRFLAVLPDDVPAVLDRLIELSLSHRWSLEARQAIAPAWRAGRLPDLPERCWPDCRTPTTTSTGAWPNSCCTCRPPPNCTNW
ncbi:hypothetical protein [Paractinoplanes durhamensis]|uniref:hypothetical protein n=1 Tax=Paractinoplanes durhamensis TaxID=113563 RepID=UPI0036290662